MPGEEERLEEEEREELDEGEEEKGEIEFVADHLMSPCISWQLSTKIDKNYLQKHR